MDFFDFRFIVNTAIGSAIGGAIAILVTLPAVIAWFGKNWSRWKRVGIAVIPPVAIIVLLFLIVPRLEDWMSDAAIERRTRQIEHWRDSPEAFALLCRNECVQNESRAVTDCNYVGNLYANPEVRTDLLRDKTLYSMLPDNLPEPSYIFRSFRKESPYDMADLARRTFNGCINKMGYVFESCTAGKQCYKIRPSIFTDYDRGIHMKPHTNGIDVIILQPEAETAQSK